MSKVISVLTKDCNLLRELQKILPTVQFHEVKNPEADEQMKNSQIIIGDYPLVGPFIYRLPKAEWIQGTWAGVDTLFKHVTAEKPKVLISRFTGKHFGTLMGEYVIANIINNERNMLKIRENQLQKIWSIEGRTVSHRCLNELNIGIMGFGNIGIKIAGILHSLGAKIFAFGRRPATDINLNDLISNYYSGEKLADFLKQCDYIVNVLPDTAETRYLLDNNMLENCKDRKAAFLNIGRGSIISENQLIDALEKKWISSAILDVFENEPLPVDSKLWTMQNVFITPHIAGVSRAKDMAEHFKDNLELFNAKKKLPGIIDFSRGY